MSGTMMLHVSGKLFGAPPEVVALRAREAVNRLGRTMATVALAPEDAADAPGLLGLDASVLFLDAPARSLHGIIDRVRHLGPIAAGTVRDGRSLVEIRLLPHLARLRLRVQSRVFQDQSAVDVMTTLLSEHRVPHRHRLAGAYPKRQMIAQRDESDFDFFARLAAESGIFFLFDHPSGGGESRFTGMGSTDVVVLMDHAPYYQPIDGGPDLSFRPAGTLGAMTAADHHVSRFSPARRVRPGTFHARAFDFGRPGLVPRDETLISGRTGQAVDHLDVVIEDGGEGDESPPEVALAKTRLEQVRRDVASATGSSSTRRLQAGRIIRLNDYDPAWPKDYVLSEVRHEAYAPAFVPSGRAAYQNEFRCAPAEVPLRPSAPKKRLFAWCETATVTGPPGREIHMDSLGRVKIQFHWDRLGNADDRTSCWVRVAHSWAGAGWGAQFIPRAGMEVVVQFLGGDIDRPLITGCVYNATHPPPFPPGASMTRNGLRSQSSPGGQGFNELSFEDAAGQELLFSHAQRDRTAIVRHDDKETVGNDQVGTVLHDRAVDIGRNDLLLVGEKHEVRIKSPSTTGTQMTDDFIGQQTSGAHAGMSGKDFAVKAGGSISLSASGPFSASGKEVTFHSDGKMTLDAGGDIDIKSGGAITISATGTITIKGGDVVVQGATIKEN